MLQNLWFWKVKPIVSHCKTYCFILQNLLFCDAKPVVLNFCFYCCRIRSVLIYLFPTFECG